VSLQITLLRTTLACHNTCHLSVSGQQVVLPIWYEITKQEVINYSPSLADKSARNTATYTKDEISEEIAEVINAN